MSILTEAQQGVKNRQEWLEEAQKALSIIMDLPAEIQQLKGTSDANSDGTVLLSLWGGEETARIVKKFGVKGLIKDFSKYSGTWNYINGTIDYGTFKIKVSVDGADEPEDCRVEPYTETVTRYRSICEETEINKEK